MMNMRSGNYLLSIIGPTAVGKTALSLKLAEALDAEIISVDSRQVYKYLDIGTDKVSEEIRSRIPHHLIDVVDPKEVFSAATFVEMTLKVIKGIRQRGKIPILVGGTPFYYSALFDGILTESLPKDEKVRKELELLWNQGCKEELRERLKRVDPEIYDKVHPNDGRRIIRFIEVFILTGKPMSWWSSFAKKQKSHFRPLYLGLYRNRQALYRAIEERVEKQFSEGFVEEVGRLLSLGYDEKLPAMQGFGYKELVLFHRGVLSLDEAKQGDIKATKAFARRQMTWFRRFLPSLWYDVTDRVPYQDIRQVVERWRTILNW